MIGVRVRIAREACRFTQKELSDISGVPLSTINSIEHGRIQKPSEACINRVAHTTSFPVSFFHLGPLPDIPEGYFRKLKRGKAKDTKRMRAQVHLIAEIVQRADQKQTVALPSISIRPISDRRERIDLNEIEEMASGVRDCIGVDRQSPIPDVIRAAERSGVVVVRLPIEFADHDGYSVWPDFGLDGRPIVAITSGCPGDRERANVAHELAHLILHTMRSRIDCDWAEKEAWRLAGAIMFPRHAAINLLRPRVTLQVLMAAKAAYGVSIGLAARRALDLNLISEHHFVSLRKQMSARGWNKNEPVDVPNEEPLLIKRIVEGLAGVGSLRERAERLHTQFFLVPALSGNGHF